MEAHLLELPGGEPAGRVRADRVEGDVAEIQQTGVTDDDVQPDGHHNEDEDRHSGADVGKCQDHRDVRRQARHVVGYVAASVTTASTGLRLGCGPAHDATA